MTLTLTKGMFVNNRYEVFYKNRTALFTVVDEEYKGLNHLGKVDRITVLVTVRNSDGTVKDIILGTTVIGLGDGVVSIRSEDTALWGKLFTQHNMDKCVVELYEDE
jgi:hypothetical protein